MLPSPPTVSPRVLVTPPTVLPRVSPRPPRSPPSIEGKIWLDPFGGAGVLELGSGMETYCSAGTFCEDGDGD